MKDDFVAEQSSDPTSQRRVFTFVNGAVAQRQRLFPYSQLRKTVGWLLEVLRRKDRITLFKCSFTHTRTHARTHAHKRVFSPLLFSALGQTH